MPSGGQSTQYSLKISKICLVVLSLEHTKMVRSKKTESQLSLLFQHRADLGLSKSLLKRRSETVSRICSHRKEPMSSGVRKWDIKDI